MAPRDRLLDTLLRRIRLAHERGDRFGELMLMLRLRWLA